jgi:hypothetical protein
MWLIGIQDDIGGSIEELVRTRRPKLAQAFIFDSAQIDGVARKDRVSIVPTSGIEKDFTPDRSRNSVSQLNRIGAESVDV